MASKTKIKKDSLGLYVIAGGWIARPFYGTMFNEGDVVKSHHFGGSTNAGVTILDDSNIFNFKRDGNFEYWCTTGTMAYEYDKLDLKTIKKNYDWYFKSYKNFGIVYCDRNQEFKKYFDEYMLNKVNSNK